MSSGIPQSDSAPQASTPTEYPPQRHAGQVSIGPYYNVGPVSRSASSQTPVNRVQSMEDRIAGLKAEVLGKIEHKPELVNQGRELRSGEAKRKKMHGDVRAYMLTNLPLLIALLQDEPVGIAQKAEAKKEQAATVAPQGTAAAETQRKGQAVDDVKNI